MTEVESAPTEAPKSLAEALLHLQGEAIQISKNDEVNVTGKYDYKFLTLDKLLEEVQPKLTALGLLWQTMPGMTEAGVPVLHYALRHPSSEGERGGYRDAVSGTFPLMVKAGANPQDLGAALTYARRYVLVTVLNIGQPDADGQVSEPQGRAGSQQGVRKITKAKAEQLVEKADMLPPSSRKLLQMAATHAHSGQDVGTCDTKPAAVKALQKLTAPEAETVAKWIDRKTQEALGTGTEDGGSE